MSFWHLYFSGVSIFVFVMSAWINTSYTPFKGAKEWASSFAHVTSELSACCVAYCLLLFAISLALAAAIWLLLQLTITVPSDFISNYFDSAILKNLLLKLTPYTHHSATSPGVTRIPMLDYATVIGLLIGPAYAAWSIFSQYQSRAVGEKLSRNTIK